MAESQWTKVESAPDFKIGCDDELLNESSNSERKVYKGSSIGQEVAVIKVKKTDVCTNSSPLTEFKILRRLSHQNIIRQFDFRYDSEFFYIPMELCDKNLEEYCRNSSYDERKRLNILEQIGKGIEYLHNLKNPIVHGDLNPRNILIIYGNDDNVTAKITDFRTSVEERSEFVPISSEDKYYLYSKPPEALRVTRKWDIYAYGCLIQTVLTKDSTNMHPYGDMIDNRLVIELEGTRKHNLKDENETDLFILADWAIDDATVNESNTLKRPSIKKLLNHPMHWNMADKELFLSRIAIDYVIPLQKLISDDPDITPVNFKFLDDFKQYFTEKYEGLWTEKIGNWAKLEKSDEEFRKNPLNLLTSIRDTYEHFSSRRRKCQGTENNTEEFTVSITKVYPYLLRFLVEAYRNRTNACELNSKDDYHDYFHMLELDSSDFPGQ